MFLILEVTSAQARELGTAARCVFSPQGGSIGRRAGNDWVLPDPHVSGHHARVGAMGAHYFLEDNNSGNGVTVNGTRIHPGEPYPLKDGDIVFIDPYEIAVRVSPTRPAAAVPTQTMSPFTQPAAAPRHATLPPAAGGTPVIPPTVGGLDDLIGPGAGEPYEYNPLLDAPRTAPPAPIPSVNDLLAKPVLNDAITLAPLQPAPVMPPPAAPAARASGGGAIPSNWDLSEPEPAAPIPPPRPVTIEPLASPSAMPRPGRPAAAPPQAPAPRPAPIPAAATSAPAGATEGAAVADFRALLRGAGLDVESVDPAIVAELGQVLRIVVDGLMEVLRARGEIKGEFRLQQTTFKPRENNPLKFSANVEDALHNLLVKRNAAYLDTPAAFEDAFIDVRHHQLAMLAGMRAAFGYMLGRFDPKALAEQFDARPGRKLSIGLGSGGRYWENFEEYFKEVTRDPDDCFRRLFGDQFARAYEEQLQRLRAEKRRVT